MDKGRGGRDVIAPGVLAAYLAGTVLLLAAAALAERKWIPLSFAVIAGGVAALSLFLPDPAPGDYLDWTYLVFWALACAAFASGALYALDPDTAAAGWISGALTASLAIFVISSILALAAFPPLPGAKVPVGPSLQLASLGALALAFGGASLRAAGRARRPACPEECRPAGGRCVCDLET